MLQGVLKYRDEHFGEVQYQVLGRDGFDILRLYLINDVSNFENYRRAANVFDKAVDEYGNVTNPYEDKNPSDKRRLDIKKASKFKTNITNMVFCTRVAAIIRYFQTYGQKNYNQMVMDGNYFATQRIVQVDGMGYIQYSMGLITGLSIHSPFVDLELRTVPDNPEMEAIFKELKEKDKYGNQLSATPVVNVGFSLSSEVLGFPYTPPIKKEPVNVLGMYETIEDVIANNPDKNTDWILSRHYEIVTDSNLERILDEFMTYDGYIAFDTETTGLNINFKSRTGEADQLVGIALSKKSGTGYYFPLQHKLFDNLCGGDHWYFMERYMKPLLEKKKLIGHNISFDWKVAYIYDINANFVYDTLLAFGVTKRYEEESFDLTLKALVKNIFGLDMFELSDFVYSGNFSNSGITFADLPYELVRRYAPADGDMTLTLFEFIEQEGLLEKYNARRIFDLEVNFAKMVGYAEFYGYMVDVENIPKMQEQIVSAMEYHKNEMFKIAGREFNPSSSKQLIEIMFNELGIPQVGEKPSTNKEVLKTLMDVTDEEGNPKYPFVHHLKAYRDNEGIFKNFLKKLHEHVTPDGFIFSKTKQLGTDTGRTSAENPNYQSYNDTVKKYIVPRPGYMHFDCDFSQIEYRVLASLAQQENLIEAFNDPDLDYHTYQASRMFGIPYALVPKSLRNQSKGINFGLPYGMGDSSLGFRIFGVRNEETKAKAAMLRRKFFQGQEKIEQFFEVTRSEGVANGFTSTYFGRRRYYHRGVYSVNEIRRQAGNHVIQGTAADIYKIACSRLFNRICAEGWLGKVLVNVFVHDELLLEVHHSINPYYFFKAWREEFEVAIEGFCKLFAGAGVGKSWYTAKKQDLSPQFIDEIVAKWHEDMEWDGDIDAFLKKIDEDFYDHKIRRIREFITAPENQGQVIKPVINTLLVEIAEGLAKEIAKDPNKLRDYNLLLGKEGIADDGSLKTKTLQDLLLIFCTYFGIAFEKIDIKSPDDVQVNNTSNDVPQEEEELVFEDAQTTPEDLALMRGYYRDNYGGPGRVYMVNKPVYYDGIWTTIINLLYYRGMLLQQGDLQLVVYDEQNQRFVPVPYYLSEMGYNYMVSLYNVVASPSLGITQVGAYF